jgi:hypothetical protein
MFFTGRDISVQLESHDIAVSARHGSWKDAGAAAVLRLYIDGQLRDEVKASIILGLFGERIVLRGQLPSSSGETRPRLVQAVISSSAIHRPLYEIFVDGSLVHTRKGVWGCF